MKFAEIYLILMSREDEYKSIARRTHSKSKKTQVKIDGKSDEGKRIAINKKFHFTSTFILKFSDL